MQVPQLQEGSQGTGEALAQTALRQTPEPYGMPHLHEIQQYAAPSLHEQAHEYAGSPPLIIATVPHRKKKYEFRQYQPKTSSQLVVIIAPQPVSKIDTGWGASIIETIGNKTKDMIKCNKAYVLHCF